MNKIKEINEFDSILDYYKYLEESLKELTEKVSNTTSKKLKDFYSEQLDSAMKKRNSIRSVVFAKKNKILHDKISNIKEQQVNDFIKTKKEEKSQLAKKKLDLELNLSFYESVKDYSKNFITPIAGEANNYNCSDFFVSDKAFNKFYLFKDDDNNLGEFTGLMILSKYLNGNFSVLNKITKRHEMKEKFLHKYIEEIKEKYPDYSEDKAYELATDNLNLHSPELLDTINKKYDFTADEYKALSDAYSAFESDCKYIEEIDVNAKQEELKDLDLEINCLSNISDSTNIEDYILKEFDNKQEKVKMFKTAAETLASDSEISKYINKNNLIKGFELSPETKLSYSEQLKEQNKLLDSISQAESSIVTNENLIKNSQTFLKKLKNTQKLVEDIGVSANAIKDISEIVEEYNSNYILPLNEAKQNYETFKNSQELGLIPYQKITFFQKIAGIFNGRNKIQSEFDSKCREFEANIKVLSHKAAINKPNYSFSDDNEYKKEIGQSIKQYIYENPDCSEYKACKKILHSYNTDLNSKIFAFKEANINSINELDNCYSYKDICKCIESKIENVQNLIEEEKSKRQSLSMNKIFLCSKYNENSSMPISPVANSLQIGNTQNEFKKQLQKIYDYKGESQDILKYKIQVENILEKDNSFLSDGEIKDLDNSAYKTAENIIQDAANDYLKSQV